MTIIRSNEYLVSIINELRKLPSETEWVEFKGNNSKPEEIGEYLSALSKHGGGLSYYPRNTGCWVDSII